MIAKTYIAANLREINSAFNASANQKHALYFAKLAILELCGWIELSMDDIVRMRSRRTIRVAANQAFVETEVIKRNYGFSHQNFRGMLIRVMGLHDVERLEQRVDTAKRAKLEAQLISLVTIRNSLAHTYVKGVTTTIDAPSVTMARFAEVYEGLCDYERLIRRL